MRGQNRMDGAGKRRKGRGGVGGMMEGTMKKTSNSRPELD